MATIWGLDVLERGEVARAAVPQVDAIEVPVLVAAAVLHVEQVPVVVGPPEGPDAALPVLGHRPEVVATGRADPHVEDAVDRGQVREPGSVRRDRRADARRIAEQDASRDQVWLHGC
jgi:hypothetical protein